jgi:hypothetical protein
MQADGAIPARNIRHDSPVATMNLVRCLATHWATADRLGGDHLKNQGRSRYGALVDPQIIRQREQMCHFHQHSPPPNEKKQHPLLVYFLVYHARIRISKTSERLFTKSGGEP